MYKWITTFAIIAVAFLIYPLSLSSQSNFSLSLDVNGAAGDQAATSVNILPDQVVAIQIFGRDIQNANGISTRFEYDAGQVGYDSFDAGDVLPNVVVLPAEHGTNPTFVQISIGALGGQATSNTGLVGTIRFRTTAAFSGTRIRLVRGELGRGRQFERVTLNISVVLQSGPASLTPDFDGDGMVGFADFVQFAGVFGSSRGDGTYQTKYDLDSDGAIGFSDFVILVNDFGKSVSSPKGGTGGGSGGVSKIYWTKAGTYHIQSANLDGSNVEDVVNTGLEVFGLNGIALDVAGGKIYWASWYEAKIQRANLDGSNIEDLVTGLRTPNGIALDMRRGKIYWTATYAHKIQRADLDGSNVEDLITGLAGPNGIVLDVIGDKMYWTSAAYNKIRRANLDGSNIEDLVTELSYPLGIALDVIGGKMYWTNAGSTDKIQRADLDGSNVEDLVTTGLSGPTLFSGPNGIALDVIGGKMYWTSVGKDKIQRSDLDGSNVEDLVTGLRSLGGIALGISMGGGSGGNGGGEGGGGGRPDLIVESPSVSDNSLNAGQSFTLRATVRNQGTGRAAATTLRYYRSSNATITTGDREVGTDSVSGLAASGTSAESIRLNVPSSAGNYFYGACVDNVSGESDTGNNCSAGVRITVTVVDDHGNTRSGATRVSLGSTTSGRLSAGDTDYFRVSVSGSGTLVAYTTGSTDTYGYILNSSGRVLTEDDDAGVGSNFYISVSVRSGTYYIRIRGYDSSTTGNYTLRIEANQESTSGTSGDFNIELVFVNDNDFTSSQKAVFRQAARHWMSIITEDLMDIDFSTNPYNEWDADLGTRIRVNDTVDDLRIFVRAISIDGSGDTLGKGGPFWIRDGTKLPVLGKIWLDTADLQRMDEEGSLWSVALHEMGHVLGIGALWRELDLLRGSSNRYFIGPLVGHLVCL